MLFSVLLWLVAAVLMLAAFSVGRAMLATRRIAAEAEAKAPATGKFVEIDGNRIHYVETGEGRPILFVHGLGGQLRHFVGPLFEAFGPGYRLIALDRPGSGYSTRNAGAGGGLFEQAGILRRFIERLELEKPLVVGHSLGGAIALALAIEHPQAISGVALVAPLTHLEGRLRPEFRALYIPTRPLRWLVSTTIAIPRSLKYAPATLAFIFGPQATPPDYMTRGGGWAGLRPSHFYATVTDFMAVPGELRRLQKRYGDIDMPMGMLFGMADRVLPFEIHATPMPGLLKGLDFETVEGLGHMVQFVEPARTAAFIRRIAERAFAPAPAR